MMIVDDKGKPYEMGMSLWNAAGLLYKASCAAKKDCTKEDTVEIGSIIKNCIMEGLNLKDTRSVDDGRRRRMGS